MGGPFEQVGERLPEANPAPVLKDGTWYITGQRSKEIWSSSSPGGPWERYANITCKSSATREDPFMYIDKRSNWHIINHMYSVTQFTNCSKSHLSDHLFSPDG